MFGRSNLAGHYMLRGEDGVVDYTVRQKVCDRVEIDRTATYLGKTSAVETQVFIPDGKPHGKRASFSRWVGDKLQIDQPRITCTTELIHRGIFI
jgi:hypothetical protein